MKEIEHSESLVIRNIDPNRKERIKRFLEENPELIYKFYEETREFKLVEFHDFDSLDVGDIVRFPEGVVLNNITQEIGKSTSSFAKVHYESVEVSKSSASGSLSKLLSNKVKVLRITNNYISFSLFNRDGHSKIRIKYIDNKHLIK